MDSLEILQIAINLVGLPLTVLSLTVLIFQNKQLEKSIRSQVYQGLIDNSLKIDQLLIEYPEFRKYIYEQATVDENTPDLAKLMGVMEFLMDVVDNLKAQETNIPPELRQGWAEFTGEIINSSAMRYFLNKHGQWYSAKHIRPDKK